MKEEAEVMSLAELKAKNEAEEAAAAANPTPEQIEEAARIKADAAALEKDEPAPDPKDDDKADEDKTDDEWKKPDTGEEPDEAKFTDGDVAKLRRKMKGQINEKKDEIAALKQQVETLTKNQTTRQQQVAKEGEPDRGDYETEAEWLKAVVQHNVKLVTDQNRSAQAADEIKRNNEQREATINKATDAHYLRASNLSQKSGIAPEAYQAADLNVRKAIDSVFPEAGDKITDALIANLGEGSEKVFYHLGVNATKRAELVRLFQEDRTGIKAAVYLGKLNATLSTPVKRESKAPDPPDDIKGDRKGGDFGAKYKKEWDEANRKDDAQAAYNIKKAARAKKVDTSKWK